MFSIWIYDFKVIIAQIAIAPTFYYEIEKESKKIPLNLKLYKIYEMFEYKTAIRYQRYQKSLKFKAFKHYANVSSTCHIWNVILFWKYMFTLWWLWILPHVLWSSSVGQHSSIISTRLGTKHNRKPAIKINKIIQRNIIIQFKGNVWTSKIYDSSSSL